RSSSSAPVEDLSSSSVRSSSSVASSSSAKSSSSSAKSSSSTKSSSSVSSSSEYVPYDHLYDLGGVPYVSRSDYKTFTDERNGRSYYYLTIRGKNKAGEEDSVTVMAENLNIGKMITYVKDQADDTTIERYCYDRDTTNCDRYGGLYQWAEMMQLPSRCNTESCADLIQPNHQGICPDGWRLLTQDDFYIVLKAENNKHGIEDVRAGSFGGYNYTGYSLVGAGSVWNRRLDGLGTVTYWYYPEEGVYSEDGTLVSTAFIAATSISETSLTEQQTYKTQGLSVRCVKVE
ncbi:FISUMP domain-containing protein, partial [Fibrobacter sp. UBA2449]|uniref:FISUMP domain-containing protein n=1 Tax=Fibrobacter sp. UBA2449 TaxID=1946529 RepID=UPI0025B9E6B7